MCYFTNGQYSINFSVASHVSPVTLQEHFGGSTLIVPDLEGMLYLKEDGKKVWKSRYFVLRASGIYYVPKGKTKVWQINSKDSSCFILNACLTTCLWCIVDTNVLLSLRQQVDERHLVPFVGKTTSHSNTER